MMRFRLRGVRWQIWVLAVGLVCNQSAVGSEELTATVNADEYVAHGAGFRVVLNRFVEPAEGQIAIFVGQTDVTAVIGIENDADYVYPPTAPALPPGLHDVVVYLVTGEREFVEIARLEVRVRTRAGFDESEVNPRLDLAINAQLREAVERDAIPSERPEFQDYDIQAGLSTRHRRGELELRTSVNISAVDNRQQAIRFGELGDKAPKQDLNDYLIEAETSNAGAALGHVTFGEQPLLISSVGNRGATVRHRVSERLDVAAAAMNGTAIVGYKNLTGLQDLGNDHYIVSGQVGYELLANRPGGARVELSWMSGKIRSDPGFNVGEITDAESSRGFGIKMSGSTESGRLRGEFNYARSRFFNPSDPQLDLFGDPLPVTATTDNARSLDLGFDVLQDYMIGEDLPARVTVSFRHERADPLYRSLGAFVNANVESNTLSLSGGLGDVSLEASLGRSQDNVDDVATLLTTGTDSANLSASIPLESLASRYLTASTERRWWLPRLDYSWGRVHQFAVNSPANAFSGFNGGSHLPDQVNRTEGVGVAWNGEQWNLSYRYDLSRQNNRQVGRALDDFNNYSQNVNLGLRPLDTLNVSLDYGRSRNKDVAGALTQHTTSYGANLNWQFIENWELAANWTISDSDDSAGNAESISHSAQAQVTYSFELPAPGMERKLPGQWFVRYSHNENDNVDNLFGFNSTSRIWTLNTGLSLSFF